MVLNKDTVIVTGINGFVGGHLARELHSQGLSVIGIGTDKGATPKLSEILSDYYQADLSERWPETPNVKAIIHLAGLAAVGPSFDDPQKYINLNSAMVTNLCEYYVNKNHKPRIILVSSGAIYDGHQPIPINESGTIGLTSPYAVSKVLNENQATYYRQRGLDCVVVRPFNHIGPGQALGFILPDFYARLSQLDDKSSVIRVGNINTKRDYTDVRDIVKAYGKIALADSLEHTVYNVCSGVSVSGSEILTELQAAMGRTNVSFEIDPALVRPTDIKNIVGDSSYLKEELGWAPQIPLQQTITDFVKSHRD